MEIEGEDTYMVMHDVRQMPQRCPRGFKQIEVGGGFASWLLNTRYSRPLWNPPVLHERAMFLIKPITIRSGQTGGLGNDKWVNDHKEGMEALFFVGC